MSAEDSSATENRVARRHKVLKQGKILLSNHKTIIDCTVRDMSETGAKLICGDPGAIPNEFRLVFPSDRTMRDVKVVWRRPDQVGVHFMSEVKKAPLFKW